MIVSRSRSFAHLLVWSIQCQNRPRSGRPPYSIQLKKKRIRCWNGPVIAQTSTWLKCCGRALRELCINEILQFSDMLISFYVKLITLQKIWSQNNNKQVVMTIYIFFLQFIKKKKTSTNALMSMGASSHFFTPLPSPKPHRKRSNLSLCKEC